MAPFSVASCPSLLLTSVDRKADVPLLTHAVGNEHRHQARGTGRQGRVGSYSADADEVHRGKRAARIEPIPAEPENQPAHGAEDDVVRQRRAAAISPEDAAEIRKIYLF